MENYKTIEDGVEVWFDEAGNKILRRNIKDIDVARDEVVRHLIAKAEEIAKQLKEFKQTAFEELDAFMAQSFERYKAEVKAGSKGNITFKTFNGEYKVQIKNVAYIDFDEGLEAAKTLIDKCLTRWANGANENLRTVVMEAFKVDKKGHLDKARILGLARYDIQDEEWKTAMQAIHDSVKESYRRRYMNFYKRLGDAEAYSLIGLDFAGF